LKAKIEVSVETVDKCRKQKWSESTSRFENIEMNEIDYSLARKNGN